MKVLHFILGKANKDRANGVNQVIAGLCKYSARHGADVRVIGKAESVAFEGECLRRDGFNVTAYSRWGNNLKRDLEKNISWADMVHLHGTYSPMNIRVGRMCESLKTPYVVTLHGGLAPQGARLRGFIKKKVFHRLFQKEHLERASAVHVLTEEESTDLFALAQPHRVFCIPNGIDLDDYPKEFHENRTSPGKIKIGYIGRLSPEKNLDALCQAVAKLGGLFDVSLQLVGPVSDYGSKVLSRYPDSKIRLLGPMYGRDKYQFLSDIDLLVIPSLTEGFSIVIAESLALETPVLVTRTSKMTYFYDRKAFFMCEPTAFGLSNGLQRAFQARGDWHLITANGRRLVEELFNWNAISARMLDAYRSV